MKKRREWNTKSHKRQARKQGHGIVDLLMLVKHFFPELPLWANGMAEPRAKGYCIYTQADYFFQGVLKNICGLKSMTGMDEMFNEETCIQTLALFSENRHLDEMPHKDSLNYYLSLQSPEELSGIREKMIKKLIRSKQFNRAKLLNQYWRVILDGTGLHCYKEKPDDENYLISREKKADGSECVRYYRKVLEAKLVVGEGRILSLDTEFIENETASVSKQDCEFKAAKRLLKRLKEKYPRMKFCIQGDALYAVEPFMQLCRENGWHYLFTFKGSSQQYLSECYESLKKTKDVITVSNVSKEQGEACYCNGIEEMAGKEQPANLFEYQYTDEHGQIRRFTWITDLHLTRYNLQEMINAGRGRWTIENQGFNEQKNGIYDIEHLNSHNYNAIKNHYLLVQIADIIFRLYLWWNKAIKESGVNIKNTSSWLLESFRRQTVTDEDVSLIKRRTSVYLE